MCNAAGSMRKFCIFVFLLANCKNASVDGNEFFSSIAGLERLLWTEVVLLADLQNYINNLKQHIDALQSEVDVIRAEQLTAAADVEGYLNNPVTAYRLISRLHTDWGRIEDGVRADTSRTDFLDAMTTNRANLSFPTKEDVVGSTVALVRLQDTYKLDVADVASGILNGIKYGPSMSWQDCFLLGRHLYEIRDFNHTVSWLKQSMQMLMQQEYSAAPKSLEFMETVAAYHHELGDYEGALQLYDYILANEPERENATDTRTYLQQLVTNGVKAGLMHQTGFWPGDYHLTAEYKHYERVCRGEATATAAQRRPLRCRYYTNNVPYRRLQPYKMEEHSLEPYIVQFHDVLTDREVEVVKLLAKSQMTRSQVRNVEGTAAVAAGYRISQSASFNYHDSRHMAKMLMHMEHLSGLNMEYVEALQVTNYGIGGHYEPHFDFFMEDHSYTAEEGNRIATGIFYLSDVEEGGGTAFVHLDVLVRPKRGSVLLWYNLHSSDDPDYRTKHAACPVLKGSKWIANIWVRVRHQDRARPCELQRGHEVSLMYKEP